MARDHRRRVRLDHHAADRPHRARAGDLRKPVVNAGRQPHHRDPGILAPHHARGAGMVLLAGHQDPVVPDADDRFDHADAQPGRVERVALLDMRFEIAGVTPGLDLLARPPGKSGALQGLAQRRAVVAPSDPIDLLLGKHAGKRMAAEKALVMAFLVGPGGDIDAEPGAARFSGKSARQLEPVDHPERAVEPTAIGLGLAVRADQQPPPRRGIAAEHIADAVDDRVEPGFAQPLGQPIARGDIDRRIGRPVHPGLVPAEFGEPLEVGDDALSVDGRHLHISFGPVECCHCERSEAISMGGGQRGHDCFVAPLLAMTGKKAQDRGLMSAAPSSPRVALLGFSIECNRFAPPATKAHFLARTYLEGDEIVADARAATPCMLPETPGFVAAMDASGAWTPVGIALAMTEPNGPVEHTFFVELLGTIERRLRAALPVDAVYICSHGAALTTEEDDPDGLLFSKVREIIGPDVPIAATLDLHTNVSERMVGSIDAFIGYRTNPHLDMRERGAEAAGAIREMLDGLKPQRAFVRLPIVPPTVTMLTAAGPYAEMIDFGQRRIGPEILNVSVMGGFAFADTAKNGLTVVVTARCDQRAAESLAREIAELGWANREGFTLG